MAQSRRVLFIAGEVTPFAKTSSLASLARTLPEQLQAEDDFEARVMMPCYGAIDEREHNLHEVIRLSGADVPMGSETETLTVKVASLPDVRLQVYFMDHDTYFRAPDAAADGEASSPADVLRRAVFFNRAALETIQTLRWGPDLIHSFGWMSGLVPFLLSSEYGEDELLSKAKSVYTPETDTVTPELATNFAENLGLSLDGNAPESFLDAGAQFADVSIAPPETPAHDGIRQFHTEADERGQQLAALYNQMLDEVPA